MKYYFVNLKLEATSRCYKWKVCLSVMVSTQIIISQYPSIKSTPPSYNALTFSHMGGDAPLLNPFLSSERQWWLHIVTFVSIHEQLLIVFFI